MFFLRTTFAALMAAIVCSTGLIAQDAASNDARLATYQDNGQVSFAMSLLPTKAVEARPNEVAVFVDTSASQAGLFHEDSLKTVRLLLEQLSENDRVMIFAVDLDVIPMTESFVAPSSPEAALAVEKLGDRAPLGSTDMGKLLEEIPAKFANTNVDRNAIYIGDGIAIGGSLDPSRVTAAVGKLVEHHVSVSSFAIGPERDIELMAAIANNTGGNFAVDSDDVGSTAQAASFLASTIQGTVFWPTNYQIADNVTELLPGKFLPLRSDRDTVMIGTMTDLEDLDVSVSATVGNETVVMKWSLKPEASNLDFAFLPKLIEITRPNAGVGFPAVGSDGLRDVARMMNNTSRDLTRLGGQAMAHGDFDGAADLLEEALQRDPNNGQADAVLTSINSGETTLTLGTAATTQEEDEAFDVLAPEQDPADDFMRTQQEQISAAIDRMDAEVRNTLKMAREEMSSAPDLAITRLKDVLDIVDRDPILDASTRVELRNQLESALLTARREKFVVEENLAISRQNEAIRNQQDRLRRELVRDEEKIKALALKFTALLVEQNYEAAVEIPFAIYEIEEFLPEAAAIEERAYLQSNFQKIWRLRRERQIGVIDTLMRVEEAHIPFSAEPPLIFPSPEEWARKVAARAKYSKIRLSGNPRDEFILDTLEEQIPPVDWDEFSLGEVIAELGDMFPGLTITISDDSGLTTDSSVSLRVAGIRLKSALKLMLDPQDCTYVVEDEVLKIISKDEAAEATVTYVYNVGDLVAPKEPLGGFGGGLGGGGGGLGGGAGGGGLGGGGGGGGLGGGAFAIDDELKLGGSKTTDKTPAKTQVPKREAQLISVTPNEKESSRQAWNRYFSTNKPEAADVRKTVRHLMKNGQASGVVDVIYGAMANQQPQGWMYEALVLALQIDKAPKSEVERALMSIADYDGNPERLLILATFMADNDMEPRALEILKGIARTNPMRPEPYVLGLNTAQNIDNQQGIRWATLGILSQAWPNHDEVFQRGLISAQAIRLQLKKAGKEKELASFDKQVRESLYRDVIIEVSWTGDADIDFYVEEPGGTVCSREVPRTTAGGILMGDQFSKSETDSAKVSEVYVVPKAFAGDYRLLVRRIWGSVPSGKVTVTIYRNYRSEQQTSETRQIELRNDMAMVAFKLDNGRRTESLAQHSLANLVKEQVIMNQGKLNADIAESQSPKALANYIESRPDSPDFTEPHRVSRKRNPGDVGYQPVITTLPEGTQMQARASTADRLYVLVSPAPLFSFIGDVDTFTFSGGQTGGQGGGGGGQGGGIGGGGGGGGGGLGGIQGGVGVAGGAF